MALIRKAAGPRDVTDTESVIAIILEHFGRFQQTDFL